MKPAASFTPNKGGKEGLYSRCRDCQKIARRKSTPARAATVRANNLKSKYGMTVAEYDAMHNAQGGLCAICARPERVRKVGHVGVRRLAVDHNHATGEIRGLLCFSCNTLIGHLTDDPEKLGVVMRYLDKELVTGRCF